MAERSLRFDLVGRDVSLGRTLGEGSRKVDRFSRDTTRRFDRGGDDAGRRFSTRFHKRLGGGFSLATGIATKAAGAIGAAFAAVQVGQFLKSAIDEAKEAALVTRQTNAVIKATGGVANVTAKDVDRLAGSLMHKVAIDDEIIATGANMLLTFKGVRNEVGRGNDIFNQATVASLDMTAAMNKGVITQEGLQSSTIRLGRALNDPLKGMTALTRVGVTFTQGQKDQIKALVEAGDKMGAQKLILAELKSEFGGAAKAAVDPWQRLSVVLGEVKERIGTALLPVLAKAATALSERILPAAERITRQFAADLAPELGRVRLAWDQNKQSILGFATSLDTARGSMLTSQQAASGMADAMAKLVSFGGDLAEFGDRTAGFLNKAADASSNSDSAVTRLVGTLSDAFGLRAPPEVIEWFQRVSGGADAAAGATNRAASASQLHAAAMRGQTDALARLRGALDAEKASEIDLRQAKLNVQSAQSRLNDLKWQGKQRSFEYKQAQLDLERAQIDLRHKTDAYRGAQQRANLTTTDARQAANQTARTYRGFAGDAARAGSAAWLMGGKIKDGLLRIPKGRVIKVTATFGFKTPPNVSMHDIVGGLAEGGRINVGTGPTADDVLVRVSRGETVVPARDSARPEFRSWAGDRGIPGFARGGMALDASFPSVAPLVRSFGGFERVIDRIIGGLATKWDRLAERLGGNPAIQAFIRSTDPLPYRWGAAGPGAYDCSGLWSAIYGKHTGRGGGAGQRYFTTASISATGGLKPGLGGVLNIGVTPGQGHMAGSYGGLRAEARSTRSGIIVGSGARDPASFARHFHMASGGVVDRDLVALFARLAGADIGGDPGRLRVNGKLFDQGGWLQPGATLAVNRTGRPEVVMPLGKLSAVFRDNLRSTVEPWLKRIALAVEGRGGGGGHAGGAAAGIRGGAVAPRAKPVPRRTTGASFAAALAGALHQGSTIFEDLSWYGMPHSFTDSIRFGLDTQWGLRNAAWAGDRWDPQRLLGKLQAHGYDKGGWLMPGATLAVNRTGRPEPVGAPGRLTRADARMIAEELAKVIPSRISVTDLDVGVRQYQRNHGKAVVGLG